MEAYSHKQQEKEEKEETTKKQPKAAKKVQTPAVKYIQPAEMSWPLVGQRLVTGFIQVFNHKMEFTIADEGQRVIAPDYSDLMDQFLEI